MADRLQEAMKNLTLVGEEATETIQSESKESIQPVKRDIRTGYLVAYKHVEQLSTAAREITKQLNAAISQTKELQIMIRTSFGLIDGRNVHEQLSTEEQIEFGDLENRLSCNDSVLGTIADSVGELEGLVNNQDYSLVEFNMIVVEGTLPRAEENIDVVQKKLEERALRAGMDKLKL